METKPSDNPIFVVAIFIFLIFFLLIPSIYNSNRVFFNTLLLDISLFNIGFFTHFSEKAVANYQTIKAMNPHNLVWEQISVVLYYTGTWAKYPFMLLLAIMGVVGIFLNKKSQLMRRFSMESLSEHNAEHFPCIAPVVGRGDYLQALESFDKGRWQIARTPVQFCVEHNLVRYENGKGVAWEEAFKNGVADMNLPAYGKMVLDKESFEHVFVKQLGTKTREYKKLPIIRQVMISAFLAYGNDDKQTAINILDTCSLSYIENEKEATCKCFADPTFIQYIGKTYEKYHKISSKLLEQHKTHELTWIMALLFFARKKGILASSQFLFLRPLDRGLWYALHQCGGQVAWSEGLSAWLHYHAEEKEEKSLDKFNWNEAFIYMEISLMSQGWLDMEVVGSSAVSAVVENLGENKDLKKEKGGVSHG